MSRIKVLEELRIMKFESIYDRFNQRSITAEHAAELLGVCERQFRRYCRRYEDEGTDGLKDRRLNRMAHNLAPVDEVMALLSLYEQRYIEFNVQHFYEYYQTEHRGSRCYTWVKNHLQEAGFAKKGKKKSVHRKKRPRKPMEGMMMHQDGSTHEWLQDQKHDLIVTFDDATSTLYSAFLVDEEGTWSTFQGVQEVIEKKGLFCSLYTDRGSHYWHTPKANGRVNQDVLTQVGRAMQQLGIDLIPAYSPEARGRCERIFRTLQGRWPQEFALAKITTVEEANRFIAEILIPKHNSTFAIRAAEEESAFVPCDNRDQVKEILCIQEQRTVNKDNTVSYKNKALQLPKSPSRSTFHKLAVKVHEYADGSMAIFHGPRLVARFDAIGQLLIEKQPDANIKQIMDMTNEDMLSYQHIRTSSVSFQPDKIACS